MDMKKYTAPVMAALEKLIAGMQKQTNAAAVKPGLSVASSTESSLSRVLTSAAGLMGEYYFPTELIGGCCPRVPGQEEDIVWNAAAEACDTERVHVMWQSVENRIWYIAVRSAELAAHPNTWCPFASLLPGMKDAKPPPVCYTYYTEESATMMTVTADGLQIHRGMGSVVRAKAERSARELGDAPVIELVPDRILKLTPAPWYSVSLFEDRARRILATLAVLSAISFAVLALLTWMLTTMVIITSRANLSAAQERTEEKTVELLKTVDNLRTSPIRDQLAKFADINDGLLAINGFLEVYAVDKNGKIRWRAVVPPNVTADRINGIGGKTIENTPAGVAIGNAAEIEFEAGQAGKK